MRIRRQLIKTTTLGLLGALAVGVVTGCASGVLVDSSKAAAQSGDLTLVMSGGCSAMPGQGADICRFVEGSPIASSWTFVLPTSKYLLSANLRIRYRDRVMSIGAPNGNVISIKWADIVGHSTWLASDDGLAQVTGTLQFKSPNSTAEYADVLGIALLVILSPGYSPMPIDSGHQATSNVCTIEYSTAGRSAISCR
jgi:hypothetical protein